MYFKPDSCPTPFCPSYPSNPPTARRPGAWRPVKFRELIQAQCPALPSPIALPLSLFVFTQFNSTHTGLLSAILPPNLSALSLPCPALPCSPDRLCFSPANPSLPFQTQPRQTPNPPAPTARPAGPYSRRCAHKRAAQEAWSNATQPPSAKPR